MTEINDDKAPHVIPFILENLQAFRTLSASLRDLANAQDTPFFIGLNGVQGAGKSVLVSILHDVLESKPYSLPTVVFSLDDLYLSHDDQLALARSHPENPLWQHRGQPGTHDIPLALEVFRSLREGHPTKIPHYNKAACDGHGDRVSESQWEMVNTNPRRKIKVVLFEGWCVGFRPIQDEEVKIKHSNAAAAVRDCDPNYQGRLGHNTLESACAINEALRQYDAITDQLDTFIHIDAADLQYVYTWRVEQEHHLKAKSGSGMTDEQVKKFIDGYYPAYELYTETLREGVFKPPHTGTTTEDTGREHSTAATSPKTGSKSPEQAWQGRQLRLVVDSNRRVQDVIRI